MHRLPDAVEGWNINVVKAPGLLFGVAEMSALDAGETLLGKYPGGLVNVITEELQVVDALAMLVNPVLVDGIPLHRADKLKFQVAQVSVGYLLFTPGRFTVACPVKERVGTPFPDFPGANPQQVPVVLG